jgi:putative ABC transport system permease protein
VRILAGDDRWIAELPETPERNENLIVLSALSGGFALMVAGFVVAAARGLSIHHRLRELALLRMVGATPRQVRRMVLGETLVVAILSIGLACALAVPLGGWLFDRLAELGVADAAAAFHLGWIPMAAGAGSGLLVALVAGTVAARRAGAARPVQALAEAAIPSSRPGRLRTMVAALCFGCGIALAVVTVMAFDGPVAASTAGPAVVLWAFGVAAILPAIVERVVGAVRRPLLAVTGLPGYLALTGAPARAVQLASAVTPIMLASGIAIGNLYLPTTQAAAQREASTAHLRADVVLSSSAGTGLAPGLIDAVRAVPGVAGASELVTSTGFVESPADRSQSREGRPLQGISADGGATAVAVDPVAGRLTDLRGDTVALPAGYARDLGRGVGDTITLRLGDGSAADLRIVALVDPAPGHEALLLPAGLLAPHTTTGLPEQILVEAAPGVGAAALARTLAEHVADHPDVTVADRAALGAADAGRPDVNASVSYLLAGMVLAYTVVSMVNTLVMATTRRRREFGLQRVTGSTRGQVLAMTAVEAALVAAIGVGLGTLLSAATLVPFSLVVGGSPVPSGPIGIYLGVAGAAGLVTMAATLVPVWFATRGRAMEAAVAPG